jgi:tetratricopeptide (TPR) repeat protein
LEKEAIKASELGELNKALDLFGKAIELAHNKASCYNNRAQVFRLKGDDFIILSKKDLYLDVKIIKDGPLFADKVADLSINKIEIKEDFNSEYIEKIIDRL